MKKEEIHLGGNSIQMDCVNFSYRQYSDEKNKTIKFQAKYLAKCVKVPNETLSEVFRPPVQLKQRNERLKGEQKN